MDEAEDIAATAIAAACLRRPTAAPAVDAPKPVPMAPIAFAEFAAGALLGKQKLLDAKVRLHKQLLDELNSPLSRSPGRGNPPRGPGHDLGLGQGERLALNTQELNTFVSEVMDEMTGLGPSSPCSRT